MAMENIVDRMTAAPCTAKVDQLLKMFSSKLVIRELHLHWVLHHVSVITYNYSDIPAPVSTAIYFSPAVTSHKYGALPLNTN